MKKATLILLLIFFVPFFSKAQDTLRLGFEEYMEWVRLYHPVSAQADLNLRLGQMELRQARGAFDPLIYGNLDRKEFKETTYYNKRDLGMKIPTGMGVELNGNFEQNAGTYLNPEGTVPSAGLLSAGASVNLGQGLILDERRQHFAKHRFFRNQVK